MTERYTITGLVQGIGFRPSVKRLAEKLGICGTVKNSGGIVEITASGEPLAEFCREIKKIPHAVIDEIKTERVPDTAFDEFKIIESSGSDRTVPTLPADIAVCDRCLAEYEDKTDRRYRHPFISCTGCGPRYSVIDRVPYDRENITMSDFPMCGECAGEYRDIKNIRCHAQTIACRDCGPVLSYTTAGDPLDEAVRTLKNGGIVAVKDIGGYHFACDANNESASLRLRDIKGREAKPFAVMFNTINEIKEYAGLSELEEETLLSTARPIVLVKKTLDPAPSVCGASGYIGAFLPCNPVQYELTRRCGALVMTSANISGEPIITDNKTIFELRTRAGGFEVLSHDRRILTPLDDSVCRVVCGRVQLIRRARGYTPLPILIDAKRDISVLALGGDLKAAFCYAAGGRAYMSQYFGDLEDMKAYELWRSNIKRLGGLLNIEPEVFVSDLHPGYFSTNHKKGERLQHHYAHMASVMAEHRLSGEALGFIFDGTGYGEDGCIRGGEIIRYNNGFERLGGLEYTELLGGDESAKNSKLTCDCYLIAAGIEPRGRDRAIVSAALKNHINTVKSSSMGRLFDAVSALLGISMYNTYEGESAIMLEAAAARADKPYPLELKARDGKWHTAGLIRDIAAAYDNGADRNSLALGFHNAIADAVVRAAEKEKSIILSGGVFANKILTELCHKKLTALGHKVYINEQVPTNDGGIALGQAWWAVNGDIPKVMLR